MLSHAGEDARTQGLLITSIRSYIPSREQLDNI